MKTCQIWIFALNNEWSSHSLKITQNVAFAFVWFWHFSQIFCALQNVMWSELFFRPLRESCEFHTWWCVAILQPTFWFTTCADQNFETLGTPLMDLLGGKYGIFVCQLRKILQRKLVRFSKILELILQNKILRKLEQKFWMYSEANTDLPLSKNNWINM